MKQGKDTRGFGWCANRQRRPPLPGAWLWFAQTRGVGREGSVIVASSPAHRQLAATLGVRTLEIAIR